MTTYRMDSSLEFFADGAGAALDAGYVYFGVSGQNPETAPIAIYWDSTLTQPAANPVRTVGGYMARALSLIHI